MSWNGFENLDLSGVEADDYAPLPCGEFDIECTGTEIKTGANGRDKRLVVTLSDQAGSGQIKTGFNLHHSSAQAQEIGLKQFKSFLVASGHPNPDRPGHVDKLVGLKCRIYIGKGKPYQKDGQTKHPNEVKRFIHNPSGAPAGADLRASAPAPSTRIDDEIPF